MTAQTTDVDIEYDQIEGVDVKRPVASLMAGRSLSNEVQFVGESADIRACRSEPAVRQDRRSKYPPKPLLYMMAVPNTIALPGRAGCLDF